MEQLLSATRDNLAEVVLVIGALGTAAYGLVDATKATWGGVSNAGFGHIARGLAPYGAALDVATGGRWREMMRAHWLNGRAKDEQKSVARALVRLGLTVDNAPGLAKAGRVDQEAFQAVVEKIAVGGDLEQTDLNILGRFDAVLESEIEAAFERAEQQYRASAKGVAALVAVGLALTAYAATTSEFALSGFGAALLVGCIAVPLAPVAKDLSSALSAAVGALRGRSG